MAKSCSCSFKRGRWKTRSLTFCSSSWSLKWWHPTGAGGGGQARGEIAVTLSNEHPEIRKSRNRNFRHLSLTNSRTQPPFSPRQGQACRCARWICAPLLQPPQPSPGLHFCPLMRSRSFSHSWARQNLSHSSSKSTGQPQEHKCHLERVVAQAQRCLFLPAHLGKEAGLQTRSWGRWMRDFPKGCPTATALAIFKTLARRGNWNDQEKLLPTTKSI